MEPGVFNVMAMMVAAILFATGWGTRYTNGSRRKEKQLFFLALTASFLGILELPFPGIMVNAGSLIPAMLAGIYFGKIRKFTDRIHFLSALITSAAGCFIFMIVVPHDPAFYLLDGKYLYPLVSVLASYLFSRDPVFCLLSSVSGILLAGTVHDSHAVEWNSLHFGSPEVMDMIATAALFSFLADQLLAALGYAIAKASRKPEGNLEGDPT
jgi:hypothetical protein